MELVRAIFGNRIARFFANWIARRRAAHPILQETTDLSYVASKLSTYDKKNFDTTLSEFLSRMKTVDDETLKITAEQTAFAAIFSLNNININLHSPRDALEKNGTMLSFVLTEEIIKLQNQRLPAETLGMTVWLHTLRAEICPELRPSVKVMWSLLEPYYGMELPVGYST